MKKILTTISLIFVLIVGASLSNHAQTAGQNSIFPTQVGANLTLSVEHVDFLDIYVYFERFDGEKWIVENTQVTLAACAGYYIGADSYWHANPLPESLYRVRVVLNIKFGESWRTYEQISESAVTIPETDLSFNLNIKI